MIFEAEIGDRILRIEVRAHDDGAYAVAIDGRPLQVEATFAGPFMSLSIGGRRHEAGIARRGGTFVVSLPTEVVEVEIREGARPSDPSLRRGHSGPARVTAPMPGKVVRVLVVPGQAVTAGEGLLVVEAMKMENELRAPRSGVVCELPAREGQAVESGALLAVVG